MIMRSKHYRTNLFVISAFILVTTSHCSTQKVTEAYDNYWPKYELKFQTELDSSKVIKQLGQQQIFKCQVRLAPLNVGLNSVSRAKNFLSTSRELSTQLQATSLPTLTQTFNDNSFETTNLSSANLNVSQISIEWFKDGRPLLSNIDESIGVINVSLSRAQAFRNGLLQDNLSGTNNVDPNHSTQITAPKSTKKSRIEIKNTLNGNQLKLTSRLRIGHLKEHDAALYKCVARASFIVRHSLQVQKLYQVDQSLESNQTTLIISLETKHNLGTKTNGGRKKWLVTSDSAPGQLEAKNPSNSASGSEISKSGSAPTTTNQLDDGTTDTNFKANFRGTNPSGNWNSLFEDDEDLFRLDPSDRAELINGQTSGATTNDENNDNTSSQLEQIESSDNDGAGSIGGELGALNGIRLNQWKSSGGAKHEQQREAYLDSILQDSNGSATLASSQTTLPSNRGSAIDLVNNQMIPPIRSSASGHESPLLSSALSNDDANEFELQTENNRRKSTQIWSTNKDDSMADYSENKVNSFLQTNLASSTSRSKLAKLVHKLAPELSCYTNVGEFYHGNVAITLDRRPCLNWLHVRLALMSSITKKSNYTNLMDNDQRLVDTALASRYDNHNSCRNPNSDPRGPWCFVAHSEQLDGTIRQQPISNARGSALKMITQKQRTVRVGTAKQLFVIQPCAIASCSEYLWLYVVAPPLGLLILIICLISLLIRSIRKSRYNSIFAAAYQRHNNACNNLNANGGKSSPHSAGLVARGLRNIFSLPRRHCFSVGKQVSGKKTKANINLDDDVFEIVDDIDWSDGQTQSSQSMSPKSSESLKLTNASFASSCHKQNSTKTTLSHSKSINPIFSERALVGQANQLQRPRLAANMSKSKSQAGPMFATLRCHVKNTQQRSINGQLAGSNNRCQEKKSSSFIDNGDLALVSQQTTNSDWISSSITSNLSDNSTTTTTTTARTGHLISCSSSGTGYSGLSIGGNNNNSNNTNSMDILEKCIFTTELPLIESTNVTVNHELQPIYEGKFSQVQWAYLKQQSDDATQATGRIGAQVAICALKQQVAIDESVFFASNLRVRNLNHLNVVKLLGYVQYDNENQKQKSSALCALVYDMAHLIDLSDWLKDQSKEAVIAQADELSGGHSLKQNLTCIAKQIALAVDFLHDKQIVYKDLACRNCFLDVTRMLVKLATFNLEPEFDNQSSLKLGDYDLPQTNISNTTNASPCKLDDINKRLSLKSMVRPKYLLDYYVIDSRPSECQLLPLSWIPLESILFNKFNKQTDIWSFGCLLYELFSLGEVAYFGYSSKQVIDSVRSNLMPPQPMLCPNGVYKLMCKCLGDIPTLRPNIKHIYEQLNLYSGQCSSFLNHHLCII